MNSNLETKAAPPGELQAQLQALRATYAARLPEKVARLLELCRPILSDEADASFDDSAHRLAHNLAGSGATYGFAQVSGAARRLELALIKSNATDCASAVSEIRAACQALQATLETSAAAANAASDGHVAPRVLAFPSLKSDGVEKRDGADGTAPEAKGAAPWRRILQASQHDHDHDNRLIFLASTDDAARDEIAQQIGYFGYTVRTFALDGNAETAENLCRALLCDEPAALLINETASQRGTKHSGGDGFSLAQCVREKRGDNAPPIVFFSHCTDMATRLQAVRAGGVAYFTHPIEIAEVIDKLDALTAQEIPEPYRVLIVDDEPELREFFSFALREAGLSTRAVENPLNIISELNDFRPDLILMDVYMPSCSGPELAAAICQQEDYVGIPIVFLSAETDVEKQMVAIGTGGDDFLTKPIRPDFLVASVRARAHRSRTVRSFMVRDSLTGLLNHTTTKEQIDIEISRARRTKTLLTLVMLDIDRFKSVNDTHGHLAGDRVIKGLSRLLQQRLRKTDIIGRYGGEEFAILLPDTGAHTAWRVIDEIRRGFAQLRHGAGDDEFHVTFSAGLATFPECENAATLSAAADKALYAAKNGGRDRVVTAAGC